MRRNLVLHDILISLNNTMMIMMTLAATAVSWLTRLTNDWINFSLLVHKTVVYITFVPSYSFFFFASLTHSHQHLMGKYSSCLRWFISNEFLILIFNNFCCYLLKKLCATIINMSNKVWYRNICGVVVDVCLKFAEF